MVGEMWLDAATRIRETVKWLIAVAAAVGGLLVGTAPLAGLGDLSTWEAVAAGALFLSALTGVAVVVWAASRVLLPVSVDFQAAASDVRFRRLRRRIDQDPYSFFGGFGATLEQFGARRELELATLQNIDSKLRCSDVVDEERELYLDAQEAVGEVLAVIEVRLQYILSMALFEELQNSFSRARWFILLGALISAGGVFGFMLVAGPVSGS
jgi:hypothetical protein